MLHAELPASFPALKSVSAQVLKSYLMKCYSEIRKEPSTEEIYHKLEKTVAMLTKFIGT